jgi:hypothetical protein
MASLAGAWTVEFVVPDPHVFAVAGPHTAEVVATILAVCDVSQKAWRVLGKNELLPVEAEQGVGHWIMRRHPKNLARLGEDRRQLGLKP